MSNGLRCEGCRTDNVHFRERGSLFYRECLNAGKCGNRTYTKPGYTRADFDKALKAYNDKQLSKKWGVPPHAPRLTRIERLPGWTAWSYPSPDPADQQAVRFARITLQQAPTPLPPTTQNRFGYWKPTKGDAVQCSRCGRRMRRQHSNPKYRDDYCPKCGAYMYLGVDTT